MSTIPKISSPHEKRTDILVYNDVGVNSQSASAIVMQFSSILDLSKITVKIVDSAYLAKQSWERKTLAVIFGAGVCQKWDDKLGKEGVSKLRKYVVKGGKYIGFCAGGYYGAKKRRFQQIGRPEIQKEGPLSFFAGKAIGPLFPTSDYSSPASAHAVEVAFKIGEKTKKGSLYYQGGCFFTIDQDTPKTKIIAKYTSLSTPRTAAIQCKVHKGRAFLCGINPQFSWPKTLEQVDHPLLANLARKLSPHELFREKVLFEICRTMHLPLKIRHLA